LFPSIDSSDLKDIILERFVLSKERKIITGSGSIDFKLECSSKDKDGRTFQ
jgi:hypothetical protein